MDIFDILTMLGGLCLFLFGMNLMGDALERRAGGKLQSLLGRLTTNKLAGLLTGIGVTGIIQSSSATTVMVVGFVNSGLMTLKQAINVIMGANIGTTVTAWILSLAGIDSNVVWLQLFKPTSFTPILAVIGIVLYMFTKSGKKKDTGVILLGFAVLMFGMDTMTGAVSGLSDVPAFRNLFVLFSNPLLGVLAGMVLTAIIQSSSASVGILQALAQTGQVTYGAAIPIIMGQNIGTCITALLSSFGTNRNAKRAAMVHLSFNVVGTAICLSVFSIIKYTVAPGLFSESASLAGIAIAHSVFNVVCTAILLPASSLLEKLVYKLVPDVEKSATVELLDERLLMTPAIAIERTHALTAEMAAAAVASLKKGMQALQNYTPALATEIREYEGTTDRYEETLGAYLVKLGAQQLAGADSRDVARQLKVIGDFERVADHAVNLSESGAEIATKSLQLTDEALSELQELTDTVCAVLDNTELAYVHHDAQAARVVLRLEQQVDDMKRRFRNNHTKRLQNGECGIEMGFVWSDILTDLERAADHCTNIAESVLETV